MKKLTGKVALKPKKTQTEQGEDAPEIPTIEPKKILSVESVLMKMKNSDGKPLVTSDQAKNLANLKFERSGEEILSLEHAWLIYEVSWMLDQLGYDATYNFLSKDWMKIFGSQNIRKKMFFENPLLERNKEKLLADMSVYQKQTDVEMGEPCKRCGSENTVAISKQCRSSDEAETIKIWCGSCGFRWVAQ